MHGLLEAIFTWLQRGAPRVARREGVAYVLDYSIVWRTFTKLAYLFPIAIAVASLHSPPSPDEAWIPAAIVGGFFAVLIPLSLEVYGRRIELTDQAVFQKSPWSKPAKVLWKDVRDVSWKASNEIVITPKAGRTVRVNAWLSGMETFAQVLEKRLAHLASTPKVVNTIRSHIGPATEG